MGCQGRGESGGKYCGGHDGGHPDNDRQDGGADRPVLAVPSGVAGVFTSRSMIVLQTLTHESQIYTPGPAMILRTSACDLPQNEQRVMREDLAMLIDNRPKQGLVE